jgi:hypothetical protein
VPHTAPLSLFLGDRAVAILSLRLDGDLPRLKLYFLFCRIVLFVFPTIKDLVGKRKFQKKSYGGVHYAQASDYKSPDPENKCVLVTPRLQMKAGSSYTVELTYSTGHTKGATLTIQQLDKDGKLVKTLEVINDQSSPSGYGNQHYKKSYTISGSADAGYIAVLYAAKVSERTGTYQVEALTVK